FTNSACQRAKGLLRVAILSTLLLSPIEIYAIIILSSVF
ncbi:uncharacterized protein METZ01_LOCUS116791, partial [marine metagenome]